jgi:hypothetical protein
MSDCGLDPTDAARRGSTAGGVEQQERVTSLRFPHRGRRLTRFAVSRDRG